MADPHTDSERLEWLVTHHASFGTQGRMAIQVDDDFAPTGQPAEFEEGLFARVPCKVMYEWHCYDGPTWRDALNKAMAAKPCADDPEHGCVNSSSSMSDVYENRWEAKYATMANHIADLSRQLAEQSAKYSVAVRTVAGSVSERSGQRSASGDEKE